MHSLIVARNFLKFSRLHNITLPRRLTLSAKTSLSNDVASVFKNEHDCLVVKWNDGSFDEYPFVYLRESCRCSVCDTDERKARTMYSPREIDLNIEAKTASWNAERNQLEVSWGDAHTSHYSSEWLKHLRYRPHDEAEREGVIKKDIKLWGQEMNEEGNLPTFQFEKLLNDEQELYKWLVTLATETGLARIQNAPKEPGQVIKLGKRVGYLVQTIYGSSIEIKAFSDQATHETGNTYSSLLMHSDFSYVQMVPFFGMLHWVQQTEGEGGASLWVDAFHAANLLYEEDPKSFEILATTPLAFRNRTKTPFGQMFTQSRHKTISVDHENKVSQMCYSDEFRDVQMPLEPRRMKSFYKAYFRLSKLLADKRTSFWCKMKSGDIMSLNNHRVLHGRSSYKDRGSNVRILDTAYFDRDCVHSKIRILAEKQGLDSPVD